MKPFRKNVAIAIDGGGIKGALVAKALSVVENELGKSCHDLFRLTAGTSTGSILSAGLAAGLSAAKMLKLYIKLGETIFEKSWRTFFWPLTPYRYPHAPLEAALKKEIGDLQMGDFWSADPKTDVIITMFDLVANKTCFVKPWKEEYKTFPVIKAVLGSCSVPTYFPAVDGRYVDGGVGSYSNPCYLAAYEIMYCLNWDATETTLISLGTGRGPHVFDVHEANRMMAFKWIEPVLGAFLQCADDQQVHLVKTYFDELDFRRVQVNMSESIAMDNPAMLPALVSYGEKRGQMILNDQTDAALGVTPRRIDDQSR